jgi:hypothetical protein
MKSKRESAATPRQVLSANLRTLMEWHPTLTSIKRVAEATADFRLNGEDVHLSNGKVGRIAAGSHTTDIDALYSLARAFGLAPWQLLVQDLNPASLPVLADQSIAPLQQIATELAAMPERERAVAMRMVRAAVDAVGHMSTSEAELTPPTSSKRVNHR